MRVACFMEIPDSHDPMDSAYRATYSHDRAFGALNALAITVARRGGVLLVPGDPRIVQTAGSIFQAMGTGRMETFVLGLPALRLGRISRVVIIGGGHRLRHRFPPGSAEGVRFHVIASTGGASADLTNLNASVPADIALLEHLADYGGYFGRLFG